MKPCRNVLVLMVAMFMGVVGPAVAQTEWVEYEGNPVLPPADTGEWDAGVRSTNCVIEVDGIYHLYYHGHPEGSPTLEEYEIGHATSPDGVTWELDPANPVVRKGADGAWDSDQVITSAVIHDGTGFRMWFSGSDGETHRGGYATSADGSTWTKHGANPVMDVGPQGSFDDRGVLPGAVIFDGERYQMWYTSEKEVDSGLDWRIGYAESEDGLSWTRDPDPVLGPGSGWDDGIIFIPAVYFDGSTYHMWYTGGGETGYAVSSDGLQWTRYWGNPVVNGSYASVVYDEPTGLFKMWFRDNGINLATSDCCSFLYGSLIPAAAFASGANGSFYRTDLDLSNADSVAVEYRLWWLPRGEDNRESMKSATFSLGAGMSVRYANVLSEVFGLEQGALGALAFESSSPHLLAMSRTFNTFEPGAAGTYGQSMPAVGSDEMIHEDERRRILFGTEDTDMRTNVGCVSASSETIIVVVELFDNEGTPLATENMILIAWSNDQFNRIFEDFQPVTGYVDVWTPSNDGTFFCYGSVLDNITSDPTTVWPQ